MRSLFKVIAMAGCMTAASLAQAVPLFYDEAVSGDIRATVGNIPLFNLDVGNNVIAATHSISGPIAAPLVDNDIFNFVVPELSVLKFVTIEFGASSFSGPLVGFGASFDILRDAFIGRGRFIDTSQTPTSPFTDVLTSVGPQNLFTRFPFESGTYDWINNFGRLIDDRDGVDIQNTSATWDYRLTFGVERIAVPEPGTLALFGFGLLALLGTGAARRRLVP
jgi:hypothetical protein